MNLSKLIEEYKNKPLPPPKPLIKPRPRKPRGLEKEQEKWREIKEYEGKFAVSNLGRVRYKTRWVTAAGIIRQKHIECGLHLRDNSLVVRINNTERVVRKLVWDHWGDGLPYKRLEYVDPTDPYNCRLENIKVIR